MEELTLKGITQVSIITGSLVYFWAWQRTGNSAIPQTKWPVNLYLFHFCLLASLHWKPSLSVLCNGSNYRITTVHKSLAWVDELMFRVFFFLVLCIPRGETESALSEYIVLQGIFLLHYYRYNIIYHSTSVTILQEKWQFLCSEMLPPYYKFGYKKIY